MSSWMRGLFVVATLGLALSACGGDDTVSDDPAAGGAGGAASGGAGGSLPPVRVGFDEETMDELRATGLGKYLGKIQPSNVIEDTESAEGETRYAFQYDADPDGAICIEGDPFSFGFSHVGSDDLFIYLQGGGACWSALCSASTKAGMFVPPFAWTDGNPEMNPLGSYNVAHVSYCDGSVFSGDNVFTEPGGKVRYHRGVANLSAAITAIQGKHASPRRIVLAGSSAGGYGTIIGTALVRLAWPDTPLAVLNDAGLGLTNPDDPSMLELTRAEWKFDQFLPPSCTACADGQFSALISWALEKDPSLRVGGFSSYEDFVIGGVFLGMDGPEFKSLLVSETDVIHEQHPDRFRRFFIEGSNHTAVIGYYDVQVDGLKFVDWVGGVVEEGGDWPDTLENGGL